MADERVATFVDGMRIPSACPNHMNPAMSYIDPDAVSSAVAIAGITSVSQGETARGARWRSTGKILFFPARPDCSSPGMSAEIIAAMAADQARPDPSPRPMTG